MDIAPAVSIEVPALAQIKLMPDSNTGNIWSGVAAPQPIIHSNVRVKVTAALNVVNPVIQHDANQWGLALQGQPYKTGTTVSGYLDGPVTLAIPTTDPWYLDVAYIGAGRACPIAVFVSNPNMTVRPPELNSQVATVTLTAASY
jgi:hypothetical protein